MAVSTTFKQMCPSCEAMVTIKEEKVGKKVECNKCKDKFIAVRPKEDDEKKAGGKSSANGKKGKNVDDDIDEIDEEEPVQVKSGKGKPASNGKAKHVDDDDEDEDDDGKSNKKSKKKESGSSKLTLGLILAGVGVVVLCVAAFFVLGGKTPPKGQIGMPGGQPGKKDDKKDNIDIVRPQDIGQGGLSESELAKLTNLLPNDTEHVLHLFFKDLMSTEGSLRDAVFQPAGLRDEELRSKIGFSLLAIDDLIRTERYSDKGWVFTVFHFKDAINEVSLTSALKLIPAGNPIDGQNYYRLKEPNPWFDTLARYSFGIPNQALMLARNSAGPTFLRIHNPQTLIVGDEAPVLAFLKVRGQFPSQSVKAAPAPTAPNPPDANNPPADPGQKGPGSKKPASKSNKGASRDSINNTFAMSRESALAPRQPATQYFVSTSYLDSELAPPPAVGDGEGAPGIEFVQTLQNLPDVNPAFKPSPNPPPSTGPAPTPPPNPDPGAVPTAPEPKPRDESYLTINPALKAILNRMEARDPKSKEKILLSSATDMGANCVTTNLPEFKDRVARRPRQVWDVALLLPETKPRIRYLGTVLLQRDLMKFQHRNEMSCAQDLDAREFHKEMTEGTSKTVARFVSLLFNHEIQLPTDKAPEVKATPPPPPPPPDPKAPPSKVKKKPVVETTRSKISVTQDGATVEFVMDLVLDNPVMGQLFVMANLSAGTLRAEMDAFASGSSRHLLAKAAKMLGEKGLSARDTAPGRFPPGAFPRSNIPAGVQREPKNRISFMAGLLPHMGQQNLFDRIRFDQSWRDPGNWLPGQTVIPQFLNPAYPAYTRQLTVGDLPLDFGATHYVGIAGVGLDAGSYKRGNPATQHKEGVFSYDESATLDEIRQGRGLSNTIVMMEVPYDGITGATPWIAGGGATLRGVPEKNSIAPFVHSVERGGKPAKGTFATTADGSVRYIDQNVSDEVFKAMCTVRGPAPENFDPNKDPNTPLVPVPKDQELKMPISKPAVTVVPIKDKVPTNDKTMPPGPAVEKSQKVDPLAEKVLAPLQGVWIRKSLELNGMSAPPEMTKSAQYTFTGTNMVIRDTFPKELETKSTFKLDATKSPKEIDMISAGAPTPLPGIYEVNDRELKMCFGTAGTRPAAFAAPAGSLAILVVLERK